MNVLWSTIKKLAKPLEVKRTATGAYDERGRWQEGEVTTPTIQAVVQPTKPSDLESLPENRRSLKSISIWSEKPLQPLNKETGQQPDIVTYQGETFEVAHFIDWCEIGGYYKAIALRVEQ